MTALLRIARTAAWSAALAAGLAVSGERLLGAWLPFAVLGGLAGAIAVWRRVLAERYRPAAPGHRDGVTVIAPTFREDPVILEASIASWLEGGADEVVLVYSEEERESIRRARASHGADPRVRLLVTPDPAKRVALAMGIRAARHPILILSDSDTLWEPGLLERLIAPFADPRIGGVGTRQRVIDAQSTLWRRAAQAMLDAKYGGTLFPALAARGGVSLLSGRTAAYRREALLAAIPGLLGETFMGRPCVSGDDGQLTWLVLQQGYRTTFQHDAVVATMMPGDGRAFVRQRARHGRNDFRRYLRAIGHGWLWRQPAITQVTLLQKLLEPLSVALATAMVVLAVAGADLLSVLAWQAWILGGRGIRPLSHLRDRGTLLRLPVLAAVIGYVTVLVKWYAVATVNRQGWGTRRRGRAVADGQGSATLRAPLALGAPARECLGGRAARPDPASVAARDRAGRPAARPLPAATARRAA